MVQRACIRAAYPKDYVRIVGQTSGNNVNAGWYIITGSNFGAHFMKFILEIFEVYGPCRMWGQVSNTWKDERYESLRSVR